MEGRECLWMFTPHQVKHRSVSFGVQSPLWSVEIRDGYVSSRDGVLQQPPCCCCYVVLAGAGVLPPRFANSSAVLAWPVLALALCTVCSLIIEVWGLIWGVGGRVKPDTELRFFFFPSDKLEFIKNPMEPTFCALNLSSRVVLAKFAWTSLSVNSAELPWVVWSDCL